MVLQVSLWTKSEIWTNRQSTCILMSKNTIIGIESTESTSTTKDLPNGSNSEKTLESTMNQMEFSELKIEFLTCPNLLLTMELLLCITWHLFQLLNCLPPKSKPNNGSLRLKIWRSLEPMFRQNLATEVMFRVCKQPQLMIHPQKSLSLILPQKQLPSSGQEVLVKLQIMLCCMQDSSLKELTMESMYFWFQSETQITIFLSLESKLEILVKKLVLKILIKVSWALRMWDTQNLVFLKDLFKFLTMEPSPLQLQLQRSCHTEECLTWDLWWFTVLTTTLPSWAQLQPDIRLNVVSLQGETAQNTQRRW